MNFFFLNNFKDLSDESSDEDDLITLNGCNQITQWQFPADIKHCPVQNCRAAFGIRSDAITHYKKRHANHSVLCSVCVKPIITHKIKDYLTHYERVHPSIPLPNDFPQSLRKNVRQITIIGSLNSLVYFK